MSNIAAAKYSRSLCVRNNLSSLAPPFPMAAPRTSSTDNWYRAISAAKSARKWGLKSLGISKDEQSWGQSTVRRIGVPGAEVHLNTRRATAFIFRWRGTSWKAAFTSTAAYLHVGIYIGIWQALWYAKRQNVDNAVLQSLGSYQVQSDVINAMTFVFSFVIAQ